MRLPSTSIDHDRGMQTEAAADPQTGDYAHRRLYVDLLVFPVDGLPRIAARAPAAATAEATLYRGDPDLPSQPRQASSRSSRPSPAHSPTTVMTRR